MVDGFNWWRKQEFQEKTTDLPQVTDKLYQMLFYRVHLIWAGFELTTLAVIDTDCIGNCKSNYICIIFSRPRRSLSLMGSIQLHHKSYSLVYQFLVLLDQRTTRGTRIINTYHLSSSVVYKLISGSFLAIDWNKWEQMSEFFFTGHNILIWWSSTFDMIFVPFRNSITRLIIV